LLHRLSDPRIEPARTSVTRVDVPADLLTAKVYVSVMGDEKTQRQTIDALRRARGRVQSLVNRQVDLRNVPRLEFILDTKFKKTMETLRIIQESMEEIHRKEARRQAEQSGENQSTDDENC